MSGYLIFFSSHSFYFSGYSFYFSSHSFGDERLLISISYFATLHIPILLIKANIYDLQLKQHILIRRQGPDCFGEIRSRASAFERTASIAGFTLSK